MKEKVVDKKFEEVVKFLNKLKQDGSLGLYPKYFLAEGGYVNDSRYITAIRNQVRLVMDGEVLPNDHAVAVKLKSLLYNKDFTLVPYHVARGLV